jgi:hypothetical protein
MRAAPVLVDDALTIRPLADPVIVAVGFDPRSDYAERFWLGVLGPSTLLLLRRIAAAFDEQPAGFALPLADTARELGLGHMGGRNNPFVRALGRLCTFDMAQPLGEGVLAVRRRIPPLNRRQIVHLPDALQAAHQRFQEEQLAGPDRESPHEALRTRARQLALSMVQLGEDTGAVESQLARWRFHPALCREATVWAVEEHARRAPHQRPG